MRPKAESIQRGPSLTRPLISLSSFLLSVAVGLVSSFTYSTAFDMARKAFYREPQAVSGVWRGHWRGVPAVTLKLEQKEGVMFGTASFNRVIATEKGAEAAGESSEIPLVNPRLKGKRLLFELHAIDEIHPTVFVEMEMSFEDKETALLRTVRRDSVEVPEDKEPHIRMKRERSF